MTTEGKFFVRIKVIYNFIVSSKIKFINNKRNVYLKTKIYI